MYFDRPYNESKTYSETILASLLGYEPRFMNFNPTDILLGYQKNFTE